MVVVTRWQMNAGAREAKRVLAMRVAHLKERRRARAIKVRGCSSEAPVGLLIRKEFDGKFYHGRVVSGPKWKYDRVFMERTEVYRIQYLDGDSEDADYDELNQWKDEEFTSIKVIEAFLSEMTNEELNSIVPASEPVAGRMRKL